MNERCDREILQDRVFMNYLFGVIAGDGSRTRKLKDAHAERVVLAVTDREWLESLYRRIKPSGEVRMVDPENQNAKDLWSFMVSDDVFMREMIAHGLEVAKSENQGSKMVSDPGYEIAFLRGLLDSDGTVSVKGSRRQIDWLGTDAQIYWVRDLLGCETYKKGNVRVAYVQFEKATEWAKKLLEVKTLVLERKTELLRKVSEWVDTSRQKRSKVMESINWQEVAKRYSGGELLKTLEKELGVPDSSITYRLKKLGVVMRPPNRFKGFVSSMA